MGLTTGDEWKNMIAGKRSIFLSLAEPGPKNQHAISCNNQQPEIGTLTGRTGWIRLLKLAFVHQKYFREKILNN